MNNCLEGIATSDYGMSWFVVSCMILGLWKYDRFLLDKIQRYIFSTTKTVGWTLFKAWVEYKDKNEMIKDGYHVDSVYLIEHNSSTYARKLDVLRVFRCGIVDETFTNKKSIDIADFINLCSDPKSNFQYDSDLDYELEVNYTFDRRKYKIIYSTKDNSKIRFPVYSESEISQSNSGNSVISASIVRDDQDQEGIDISDMVLMYAGPLGNFYDDSEFIVKRDWLAFEGIDDQAKIKMMDLEFNEYLFTKESKYISLEE